MHPSEVANRVEPGLGEAECLALDLAGRQEEEECENPQEVRLPPHGGGLVWKAFHKSMLLVKNMVKSMVFYLSLFVQNVSIYALPTFRRNERRCIDGSLIYYVR